MADRGQIDSRRPIVEKGRPPSTTELDASSRDEGRPQVFSSTVQEILFVAVATMAIAMSSLVTGTTTVLTAQVQRDLGMSTAELTWLTGSSSCVRSLLSVAVRC